MGSFATFDDLKDLYNRVLPQVKTIEDTVHTQKVEVRQQNMMVARFDEILADKLNKKQLADYQREVDLKFLSRQDVSQFKTDVQKVLDEQKEHLTSLNDYVSRFQKQLNTAVQEKVRKAIGEFKNEKKEEASEGQKLVNNVMDKFSNVFSEKADVERVTTLEATKANKSDME